MKSDFSSHFLIFLSIFAYRARSARILQDSGQINKLLWTMINLLLQICSVLYKFFLTTVLNKSCYETYRATVCYFKNIFLAELNRETPQPIWLLLWAITTVLFVKGNSCTRPCTRCGPTLPRHGLRQKYRQKFLSIILWTSYLTKSPIILNPVNCVGAVIVKQVWLLGPQKLFLDNISLNLLKYGQTHFVRNFKLICDVLSYLVKDLLLKCVLAGYSTLRYVGFIFSIQICSNSVILANYRLQVRVTHVSILRVIKFFIYTLRHFVNYLFAHFT